MSVQPNPRADLQNWYRLEIFPIMQIDPTQHQLWLESLWEEVASGWFNSTELYLPVMGEW